MWRARTDNLTICCHKKQNCQFSMCPVIDNCQNNLQIHKASGSPAFLTMLYMMKFMNDNKTDTWKPISICQKTTYQSKKIFSRLALPIGPADFNAYHLAISAQMRRLVWLIKELQDLTKSCNFLGWSEKPNLQFGNSHVFSQVFEAYFQWNFFRGYFTGLFTGFKSKISSNFAHMFFHMFFHSS